MDIKNKIQSLIKTNKKEIKEKFPIEVFPKELQSFFIECNEKLDLSIDFMASSFLWGCSTLIGNSYKIRAKNGWFEYANIWIACVGDAGVGKTPSIAMAIKPFEKINNRLISDYSKKHKLWQESSDSQENEPKKQNLIVNDTTIEALVSLHSKNPNAIGMFREELDGWVKNMSRYSAGSDMPFWLQTWSGKSVSMTRKTGDSHLPNPFIPILGGVQPIILESFSTQENNANGFLDRILLACPDLTANSFNEDEVDEKAIDWYDDFVNKIYRVLSSNLKTDENDEIVSRICFFDNYAKNDWKNIYNEVTEMQNSDEENEYMKSMLPKQKSYIPRFALLLHIISNISKVSIDNEISSETIKNAWKISQYFIFNAKKVKVDSNKSQNIQNTLKNSDNQKEAFTKIYAENEKVNYTKVAKIFGITRMTLYRWRDELDKNVT